MTAFEPEPAPPADTTVPRRRLLRRRSAPRRHWVKRRWLRRTLIASTTLVVLFAAVLGAGYGYLDYRFHQAHIIKVHHLVAVKTSGPHGNSETILLVGSTSRCVLDNKQAAEFGSCSGPPSATTGITGVNADVMMLLHTDPSTGQVSILSIPRDLVLYNVREGNFFKFDAALAAGPSQLVAAIEQDLGIPVNHFVELNFDTFQSVVNTLGGVKVYFPDTVRDPGSGLDITTPGCHALTGFQALALVRARHMSYWHDGVEGYDGSGDLGRIIRDHEFLRILATAVAKRGLDNPIVDNSLLSDIVPDLTLDSTFSLGDMVNLILDFHAADPNKAQETTLPNIEDHTDYMYEGYDYGSVVLPSYPQDQQAIDQFLGTSVPPASAVRPASVSVRVLDGIGNPASASSTASRLGGLGYHVVGTGSWPAVGPISETVVEYSPGHETDAERVMRSLSGIVSMTEAPTTTVAGADVPTSPGVDVTVITGTNFSVASPGTLAAARGGHHRAASTPSSLDSQPAWPILGPVSSAKQVTPPYDPRACPSS